MREYRAGDPLRRIHWRSSARLAELVVREYEPPGVQTVGIFCDASPGTREVADQIARLAASEAWDCIRGGGRVVLWGPGLEPSLPSEARSFWALLEWLGRYPQPAGGPADLPSVTDAVGVTAGSSDGRGRGARNGSLSEVGGSVHGWSATPGSRPQAPINARPLAARTMRRFLRLPPSPVENSLQARAFVFLGFAAATLAVVIYGQDYIVPAVGVVVAALGHVVSYRGRGRKRSLAGQVLVAGLVIAALAYFLADSVGAIFGGVLPQANFAILLVAVTSFDLKTRRNCYSSLWISLAILYLGAVFAWDYAFGLLVALWAICLAGFWMTSHLRRMEAKVAAPIRPVAVTLVGALPLVLGFILIQPTDLALPARVLASKPPAQGELVNPALRWCRISGDPWRTGSIDPYFRGRPGFARQRTCGRERLLTGGPGLRPIPGVRGLFQPSFVTFHLSAAPLPTAYAPNNLARWSRRFVSPGRSRGDQRRISDSEPYAPVARCAGHTDARAGRAGGPVRRTRWSRSCQTFRRAQLSLLPTGVPPEE